MQANVRNPKKTKTFVASTKRHWARKVYYTSSSLVSRRPVSQYKTKYTNVISTKLQILWTLLKKQTQSAGNTRNFLRFTNQLMNEVDSTKFNQASPVCYQNPSIVYFSRFCTSWGSKTANFGIQKNHFKKVCLDRYLCVVPYSLYAVFVPEIIACVFSLYLLIRVCLWPSSLYLPKNE